MVEEGNIKALVYSYMQTNPWTGRSGETMLKRLVVQLDQAGLVSKVDYAMGESE